MQTKGIEDVLSTYPMADSSFVMEQWKKIKPSFTDKIIVLDDDPTGVQTVHNVSVYTDWNEESIEQGFLESSQLFFILTNSRALTKAETKQVHIDIATRIERVSKRLNKPYLIISRSDSTLRGHYPLETKILKQTIEERNGEHIHGEVIVPFFKEGGRLTIDNVHYIQTGQDLVPVGETEFAKDRTFGYKESHLGKWIEEKTSGEFKEENTTYISLSSLREFAIEAIVDQLLLVSDFNKVVVNALDDEDIYTFSIALIKAMEKGKRFIFRTGATFTKVIGNIPPRKLLTRQDLIETDSSHGGLIVVGSHVRKTTEQLKKLQTVDFLHFIEFDCHLVQDDTAFQNEVERVKTEAELYVSKGTSTVIYTKRERLDLGEGMQEQELKLSTKISDSLTSIVHHFSIRPNYIIAKGGITSSDVGTKGLSVKRAIVAGQIAAGVPVWKIGEESVFPHIPYVVFPGNVGDETTLKEIVLTLENK
jgi:uncharacterized protein YgbK (DUF1537 family)